MVGGQCPSLSPGNGLHSQGLTLSWALGGQTGDRAALWMDRQWSGEGTPGNGARLTLSLP